MAQNEWWRGACIYQIYPRSFSDTNNDGIGDLNGITKKMDYIHELDVDGIWISPFFKSPMKDFGYDVSGYRDVDAMFGNMASFDNLLKQAHKRDIKVIIDLVLSHTSDQHPWFADPSKKDWYVWADAKPDGTEPNNWVSVFGGSAWEWNETHQQYYFHNFLKEQPDLNYHNPNVRKEILDICKFWLEKGVDGFRLDTVNFYFHDPLLRNNPPRTSGTQYATQLEKETPYSAQQHIYDKSRPENLEFIKELRDLTNKYDNRILIGEIGDDDPYKLAKEYTKNKSYLHTTYNPHMMSGVEKELNKKLILDPIKEFFDHNESDESIIDLKTCPSWAFSNHDVVRVASRWYKEYDHNAQLSKMLIALLGCLPGTIFIYQGEELGLPEAKIPFNKIQDPWAKETWPQWQGRDGCRTPIPWNNGQFNGFTETEPWLPIAKTHESLNIENQKALNTSNLSFTKALIKWRKKHVTSNNPKYKITKTSNSKIIHITILKNKSETNCIFNLSHEKMHYKNEEIQGYDFRIDGFKKP